MSAVPLTPRALYEEVAELLRQRIFNQELEPGEWIDELKLAEAYGISRTPLREALKVLAAEGLITMKVRRGAYVTEVSERDLTDVYHLLSLLESDAAETVATTAPDSQMAELAGMHAQLEAALKPSRPDYAGFLALNIAFHTHLLEIANNRWRTQMVSDLRKIMKLKGHSSLFREPRARQSLREHDALMKAIAARDGPAAMQRMQEHFQSGLKAATGAHVP
ncbi:GntR family transcriptional regulator [soil metagenome]